jgi:type I restriction-modification system DNA methylase subunit
MTSTRKEQNWIHEQIDFLLENLGSAEPGDFLCDFSLLLYSMNEDNVDGTLLLPVNKQEWQLGMEKLCSKSHWLRRQQSMFGRALAVMDEKRVSHLSDFLKNLISDKTNLYENSSEAFCYLLQTMFSQQYIKDFITPSTLCALMACMIAPQKGEVILEPVCGSGRLLVAAAKRNSDCVLTGIDVNARMIVIAFFNMYFNGKISARLYHMNFLEDLNECNRCDVVLANPPYGDDIHMTIDFVDKIMEMLKTGGRCGILVPEGFLTSTVRDVIETRIRLLETYTLEGIVALPRKIYKPYTESNSSLIMLKKQSAAPDYTVFLSRLPEWDGGNNGFSDQVYKQDMDQIAAAWQYYKEKNDDLWRLYGDNIAWSVSSEEIRRNDYIFAADSYIKPKFLLPETQLEELRDNVIDGYNKLERAISNYFDGDFETWL